MEYILRCKSVFSLFSLIVLVTVPCVNADTIKGKNGTVELKLPDGWKQMDIPAGTPDAVELMGINEKADLGVMVVVEDAADSTQSLDEYGKAVTAVYKSKFTDVSTTDPKPIKVNGKDAVQMEVKCTVSEIKLGYLITAMKQGDHFEQIVSWAGQTKFGQMKSAMAKLPDGLKLSFGKADTAATPDKGPDQVFKGKDGTVQITLPAGWNSSDSPDEAEIQLTATNTKLDLGLMVTVENRQDLTYDLKTYAGKVADMLMKTKAFTDASKSGFQTVKVNGNDAMQFEFHATRSGIKLAYLVTIMQSEKNFLRVTAWSAESKFKTMKPTLAALAGALKELPAHGDK